MHSAVSFKKDDRVIYHSPFSGLEFPAVVTNVREGGFVDLMANVIGSTIEKPDRFWRLVAVRVERIRLAK